MELSGLGEGSVCLRTAAILLNSWMATSRKIWC